MLGSRLHIVHGRAVVRNYFVNQNPPSEWCATVVCRSLWLLTMLQASNTRVGISVIADDQEHAIKLPNTLYDGTLQKSLISKANAVASHGAILPRPGISLTDHNGQTHTSTSTISLRWYYDNGLQTFQETFYVVDRLHQPNSDKREWDAVLRAGVEPCPEQSAANAFPYMNVPQGHDPGREREQRERLEKSQKQFEAQREAQAKEIRAGLTKNLKPGIKR